MKVLKNNKKIIMVILVLIMIAGVAITLTTGLNWSLDYSSQERLVIVMTNEFHMNDIHDDIDISEIRTIVDEVFGGVQTHIQTGDTIPHVLFITARTISEAQIVSIVDGINELYGVEVDAEAATYVISVANVRGRDIVRPYLLHITISILLILIYAGVRYRKVGPFKVNGVIIGMLAGTQLMFLSIMAITRIPVGRWAMPIVLVLFVLASMKSMLILEKMNETAKETGEESQGKK